MGRMVDDMHEESEKPVDEISPGAWLIRDAAFKKIAVDLGKSHGFCLCRPVCRECRGCDLLTKSRKHLCL